MRPYRDAAVRQLVEPASTDRALNAAFLRMRESTYRSSFSNWHQRSSVRTKPARSIGTEGNWLYFPPELAPEAAHPLVTGHGDNRVRAVLVQRLYQYLHFTSELEALSVIPIATSLSRGRAGVELPAGMRKDAFKIVTDEAWHAQFSFDLLEQVASYTGMPCEIQSAPQYVDDLDALHARLPEAARGTEGLVFSIVSETLISTILADLPQDRRLPPAVRDTIRDHAEDEGRHHAYFRSLLQVVWPALGKTRQRAVGPWLPEIIFSFLRPDFNAAATGLRAAGLRPSEVEQILVESYPTDVVRADMALAARATVRYFTEVGALDDPATSDAFEAAGLTGSTQAA